MAAIDPARCDNAAFFDALVASSRTPNGVSGFKAEPHIYRLARRYLAPERHLWLRRRDVDAQAVSCHRALATGVWQWLDGEPDPRALPAAYDYPRISGHRQWIEARNAEWAQLFAADGITPLPLWYEDLVADPAAVVAAIAGYLGVALDGPPDVATPRRVMRDDVSAEWAARLRAEDARASCPAPQFLPVSSDPPEAAARAPEGR